jgi:hypothetical protein
MHIPVHALAGALALSACMSSKADAVQLSSPRAAHASVALDDGRILLLGGCVRNGCEAGPASAIVDIFDPAYGTFSSGGQLLAPKVVSEAVKLPDGRILVVGGWDQGMASASAEIFDPKSGRSQSAGSLSTTRGDVSVVALADGRVLVAGGFDGRRRLAGAEVFDPRAGQFTPVGPLNEARSGTESVLLQDGRVLVIGGVTGGPGATRPLASAEIFDPATGRFTPTGSLIEARFKHAALRLPDGRVLVIAGSDERERSGGKKRTLEIYDPALGEFKPGGTLRHARYKLTDAVTLLAGGRVLIGGSGRYPDLRSGDPEEHGTGLGPGSQLELHDRSHARRRPGAAGRRL